MTNPLVNLALIPLLILAHSSFIAGHDAAIVDATNNAHGDPDPEPGATADRANCAHTSRNTIPAMGNTDHAEMKNSPPPAPPSSASHGMMRIPMKHRDHHPASRARRRRRFESLHDATRRDAARHRRRRRRRRRVRIAAGKSTSEASTATHPSSSSSIVYGNVESGARLGSGEYFVDVHIGSPGVRVSLVVDTGSDLTWAQCSPCERCYQQRGPVFTPGASSSYRLVPRSHPMCGLVSRDAPGASNRSASCEYLYAYGDESSTVGELAFETFTLYQLAEEEEEQQQEQEEEEEEKNGSQPTMIAFDGVVFGCGHRNEGHFLGASGLLGLGRGPLSFPSQMHRSLGHRKFSYCLADRNGDDDTANVFSTLTFGEDLSLAFHPRVQYTRFVTTDDDDDMSTDTFYYVDVKAALVAGRDVGLAHETWAIDGARGRYGTIIDSGTTLIYFAREALERIVAAIDAHISYPKVAMPLLGHCYNASGQRGPPDLPGFSLVFADGAVLAPPPDNYFLALGSGLLCLAMLEAPPLSPSILGNHFQQNTHLLYDLDNNRLGFVPIDCGSV